MLLNSFNQNLIEAGIDEAGRGCLAGPVVAAAVILPKDYQNTLLNDSKKLTSTQRESLKIEIESHALAWGIGLANKEEIDEINILNSSFLAMHRAIENLKLKPEHLLIDGNRFSKYMFIPHTCIIKGDGKYQNIAAASILAKTFRDQLMQNLSKEFPQYGWHKNMGYATIKHRQSIFEHGTCIHHRTSFKVKSF